MFQVSRTNPHGLGALYNRLMTNRRHGIQAAPLNRKRLALTPTLLVMPRSVKAAAEQGVAGLRPSLLRYIDLHPALALLTGVAIIALVCVIYLSQVTAVTQANYTLQALQSEHAKMLQEGEELRLQIGRAQSLQTIDKIAREKLQMVPVGDQYIYLTVPDGPLAAMPPLPTPVLPVETAQSESP